MREKTVKLYKFEELSDKAKEKARNWYRDGISQDMPWMDETVQSLKAVFKASGITIKDWSLGAYNQNNFVRFDMGDAESLTGKRALAWLENNLFNGLRIGDMKWKEKRKEYLGYGDAYRPGKVPPCPLTGYCADDDFLDYLKKSVKSGDTLKEAFQGLADECGKLLEAEYEHQTSDEAVDESIEINGYEFTEDGKRED